MIPGISETTLLGFSAGVVAILILAILKEVLNKLIKWDYKRFWHIALIAAALPLFLTSYRWIGAFLLAPVILYVMVKVYRWRRGK